MNEHVWKLTGSSNGCGNTTYPDNLSKEALVFLRRSFLPVGRHGQEIGRIEKIKDDDADGIRTLEAYARNRTSRNCQ